VDAGRRCLAEAIGTFVLVLATVGATVVSGSLVGVAVATGLALAAAITALGPVSGAHFNPAVTAAFLIRRLIPRQLAALYVVAQVAGAVVAMLVIDVAYPAGSEVGATQLADGTSPADALFLEAVLTFVLVVVILAVAVGRSDTGQVAGLVIGAVVAASILTIGPLTGSSLNPARSLGPQLVLGEWDDAWVFWIAPVVGGLAGSLAFRVLYPSAGQRGSPA
jgi:MIP family channel proteins